MKKTDRIPKFLIAVSLALVAFSFISPLLFTQCSSRIDFTGTGQIGDTIGGIMNPFVGIAGIAMMYLAFHIQHKANELIARQFEINKFENQFFELLKIHKINSDSIMKSFPDEGDNESPDRGFKYIVNKINREYADYKQDLDEYACPLDNSHIFNIVYSQQWQDCYGHYFRHLFLLVKFVVSKEKDKLLKYEDARDYIRIVRASLSTYEQIFIYYNWLSGFAKTWEESDKKDGKKFFTDYRIIHNIDPSLLISDFYLNVTSPFKELLHEKNWRTEDDKDPGKDSLFEYQDWG